MARTTTCNQCLSLHAHLTPEVGQKVKTVFFLKPVMLHIKLKAMIRMITCKQIVCPYTRFKGQDIISSKSMLNIKMNMKFWSCTYHGHLYHGWVGELGVL